MDDDDRRRAFEALYTATFSRILGYAMRRCGSAEDAADIAAETFAVAWRRLDDVPPGEQARLWLYGVARNVVASHRRGQVRDRNLTAAIAAELITVASPSASDAAAPLALARAFADLPAIDREVLSLLVWEGLDHAQIAAVLGCSRNAVRIRLHRARRRLSRELATDDPSNPALVTSRSPR